MSVLLGKKRGNADPGYFRIGHVVLTVPPEQIGTQKVMQNEELSPLRSRYVRFKKTGHSRWDVTIGFKSLLWDGPGGTDYSDWESLQQILAMFIAAPFVEVENAHLRQLIVEQDPSFGACNRMAFGLRQLRVDTLPDVADGLNVSLTMSLFNYAPYSKDFAYMDGLGAKVSANKSDLFRNYIENWVDNNLNSPKARAAYPSLKDWRVQEPGLLELRWRKYGIIPLTPNDNAYSSTAPAASANTPAGVYPLAAPQNTLSSSKSKWHASNYPKDAAVQAIIVAQAQAQDVDPNLCLAIAQRESSFNPNAANPHSTAKGLFQTLDGTDRDPHVKISNPFDPTQSARGGISYFKYLLGCLNGDPDAALMAYAAGLGNYKKLGPAGILADPTLSWIGQWHDDIKTMYKERVASAAKTPAKPIPTPVADASAMKQVKDTASAAAAAQGSSPAAQLLAGYLALGWKFDHSTERAIFMYKEYDLEFQDKEHSGADNPLRAYPTQFSVLLVNNLVQIPLESFQYPTYQHCGPAGTMVSISFLSNGDMTNGEPEHPGLSQVAGMVSVLEDQYHRMRSQWRSVDSVHRMQAVVVENQILNMLGIYGVIPQTLSTETVGESPSLVQGALLCKQYENVFESIYPFQVKGSAMYQAIYDNIINKGNWPASAKTNPAFQPLIKYQKNRAARATAPIYTYLMAIKPNWPLAPMPVGVALDPTTQKTLLAAMDVVPAVTQNTEWISVGGALTPVKESTPSQTFATANPDAAAKIRGDSTLSYTDYLILTNSPQMHTAAVAQIQAAVDAQVTKAISAGSLDPLSQLYDSYLGWLIDQDQKTASAVSQLTSSPEVQQQLKASIDPNGPGNQDSNGDHCCYKDLGLQISDSAPAGYFYDYKQQFQTELTAYAKIAAADVLNTAKQANPIRGANGDTQSGDSLIPVQSAQTQQDNVESILNRTVIPFNSMSRAYPTFKLFLIEEDNSGAFFMYDDFYSFASVLNMEVIKGQDGKDTAVVQVSNLANLLSHKLYDGSTEGRYEYSNDPQMKQQSQSASNGVAIQTPIGTDVRAQRSRSGITRDGWDFTPGLDNSLRPPNLQYYALQTGSKIQIRMGFSNNPDELYPVFSGKVTQIEEGEIMTIIAQGFAIELMDPAPDDISTNGYTFSWLGQAAESLLVGVKQMLVGSNGVPSPGQGLELIKGALGRGPAYGGFAIMGDTGNTTSVIQSMLRCSTAKHFGHWQVGVPVEETLKGYGYAKITADLVDWFSQTFGQQKNASVNYSGVSAMLQNGYDRSGENVFISFVAAADGTVNQTHLMRDFLMEAPFNLLPASYYVPKDAAITPWRIIQDVRRRYPEYICAVKPYGFPYGCDATLVFANPNDFYLGRMPTYNEAEIGALSASDITPFLAWWKLNKKTFQSFWDRYQGYDWPGYAYRSINGQPTTARGYLSGQNAMNALVASIENGSNPTAAFTKVMTACIATIQDRQKQLTGFWNTGAPDSTGGINIPFVTGRWKAEAKNLQAEMVRFLAAPPMAMQALRSKSDGLSTEPRPNDRMQPVRKWHLVTYYNIIHNGIQLNGDIYNAVRVDENTVAANDCMSAFAAHLKVLDCDGLIIDPVNNVRRPNLYRSYAQSFLKDELSKMYRGELVLSAMPEVEPFDIILLVDPENGMMGPIEVDTVIQAFDLEMGHITIVKPKAVILVNEAMTAGLGAAISKFFGNCVDETKSAIHSLVAAPASAQVTIGTGALATTAGSVIAVNTVAGAAAWATGGAVTVAAGPAVAGLAVALLGVGMVWMASKRQDLNPVMLAPLSRYGIPWIGGVDGWRMADMHSWLAAEWKTFNTYELQPTLKGARDLYGIGSDFNIMPSR